MIRFWLLILGIPILLVVLLAMPTAAHQKSWLRFFVAMVLSFLAVVLPLFVFFVSSLMMPDWKGACGHGWLDCFILGKLALAPLALMATAALYSVEVLRARNRTKAWIVLGVFIGAMVSVICLVFSLTCLGTQSPICLVFSLTRLRTEANAFLLWLLVPLYIAVWYSLRATQLVRESQIGPRAYLGALLGSLPFWIAGVVWSRSSYAVLPDVSPGCFIVTAAGRGHRKFVGPFMEVQHRGQRIQANQQLLTLWQFEHLWRRRSPRSHKYFRCFYNRIGPAFAAHIKSPWLADLAYVMIKPIELVAKLAVPTPEKGKGAKT